MNDKDKLFFFAIEDAEQRQKEALFWRYEYVKRNFYSQAKEDFAYTVNILQALEVFLSEYLGKYPSEKQAIASNGLFLLYKCVFLEKYGDTGTPVYINGFSVRDLFNSTNLPKEVIDWLSFLINQSEHYGYHPWDLVKQIEMEDILKSINSNNPLPAAPIFHVNWRAKELLPEDVLTVVSCNPYRKNKKVSLQKEILERWYNKKLEGELVTLCGITRCPDLIVMAQVLSPEFDIDKAIQQIRDAIANKIFLYKTEHQQKLTANEKKALLSAYDNQHSGQYGKEYSIARAAGLWLWDYLNIKNPASTKIEAIKTLKSNNLCPSYSRSSPRTLYRLIEATNRCIEAEEVLPIKA